VKVLVVDDALEVVDSVRLGFAVQWREVDVLAAGTGKEALDLVEHESPDLVLLDVGLPDVDGFKVLQEIRFDAQEVRVKGERVDMTPTEYKPMYHLVRNAGRTLTHGTLLAKVWGREYRDEVDYLRVYVRRLRDKLGDEPEKPRYIRTQRGLGYRFLRPA
jgi:DNA-binding response OmpR family regulator